MYQLIRTAFKLVRWRWKDQAEHKAEALQKLDKIREQKKIETTMHKILEV